MNAVLDASALLAVLRAEPGADNVLLPDKRSHISAVNLGEVFKKTIERNGDPADVSFIVESMSMRVHSVASDDALRQARLWPLTKHLGLSLGDRICLALGQRTGFAVLTAERRWAELDLGVDIRLFR